MIQKNELRIGNLVKYQGNIESIYAIKNSGVDFYRGTDGKSIFTQSYVFEGIEPIPVTEEWSLKFGYECLAEMACNFSEKSKYIIEITPEDLRELYVHQAQNLYFALTMEELILKN